jgi:hypothetical protein
MEVTKNMVVVIGTVYGLYLLPGKDDECEGLNEMTYESM